MKKLFAAIALIGLLVTAGCGTQDTTTASPTATTQPTTTTSLNADEQHQLLAEGNSDFAFALYRQLKDGDGNLFYSPYSISSVMAMVYAGANGDTETEIRNALNFNLPEMYLHSSFQWLQEQLASRQETIGDFEPDEMFKLHVVNDIWGQKDYRYLQDFLDTLEQDYGAGLREMDFIDAPEEARQIINDYISEQTEDRINDLIPSGAIDAMTRLVLTNAIYFNATWFYAFSENATAPADFHLLNGSNKTVDMMHQTSRFNYITGDDYQAIEMLYRGNQTSMVVILPEDGKFAELEDKLDTGLLTDILNDMQMQEVKLSLPKFEFESEFSLNDALAALGMPGAFTASADFSGITDQEALWISKVIHKSFVSVDEEGTEAAAASAVIMLGSAPLEPEIMTVDRPFIFLIRDIPTNTVLFLGRVMEP